MKIARNWRDLLRRAWSIRLMILAGILSGLEVALPLLDGFLSIHPGVFASLSALTVAAAFVARLIAQKGITHDQDQT